MDRETLIALTADIVSAHVENNNVTVADMPDVIRSVYEALANVSEPAQVEEPRPDPAVSIRSSVKRNAIACLECGGKFQTLKRHLSTDHNLTPEEYKRRWGLAADYPLVASDYVVRRRELAVMTGFGRKPEAKPKRRSPRKTKVEAS